MDKRFEEIRKEIENRKKIPKPFAGLYGTGNTVQLKTTPHQTVVQLNIVTRIVLVLSLALFGPGIVYLYLFHPEKWNQNLPSLVKFGVAFMVGIGNLFFFKFLFTSKKIIADHFTGEISLASTPLGKTRKIQSHEIQEFKLHKTVYRSSKGNHSTLLWILSLKKTDGEELGLFITSERQLIDQFIQNYGSKELSLAS